MAVEKIIIPLYHVYHGWLFLHVIRLPLFTTIPLYFIFLFYSVQVPDSEIGLGYYVVYIVHWNSQIFLSGLFNPLGLYRDATKLLKGITSFLQLFHYFPTAFFTTML